MGRPDPALRVRLRCGGEPPAWKSALGRPEGERSCRPVHPGQRCYQSGNPHTDRIDPSRSYVCALDPDTADPPAPSAAGGGSCAPNSFDGATRVLMADGTTKPIRDVKVGDLVLATNRTVTAVRSADSTGAMAWVVVDTPGPGDGILLATAAHPFWDQADRRWEDAADLDPTDQLRTPDGQTLTVTDVRTFHQVRTVYNLTVDVDHTYHVLAGNTPVLVHNAGPCGPVANNQPGLLSLEMFEAELAGVNPVTAGTPEFAAAISGGGSYLWTVGERGELNMIVAAPGIHHTVASGGGPVLAAGQITFRNGTVSAFDNLTGHYTPCGQCAASFIRTGVDAFGSAGVRVPLAVIRDYGGRAP